MQNLVNKERLISSFCSLVAIDSLSYQERKMTDELSKRLKELGFEVYEDQAGEKIGGNSGNIIAKLKGNVQKDAMLFLSHMDTVAPGEGKKPIISGNRIHTDGSTVLGGDDASGIASILEMIQVLQEQGLPHGDIYVIFTVAEEMGLQGSKNLDAAAMKNVNARYGFILDDFGNVGTIVSSAPAHAKISVSIFGKSVHAGIEPEKGINAVQILADAVYHMKLGRIDEETTANIGVINGGKAMNIVCEQVEVIGEARSRDEVKLEKQVRHMRECFEKAAQKFGGKVDFKDELLYQPINLQKSPELIKILESAAEKADIKLEYRSSGGGSDANILNGLGIPSVNLASGYYNMHTTEEYVEIDELIKLTGFILAITQCV
jgi:tripeptide aminopeptidase